MISIWKQKKQNKPLYDILLKSSYNPIVCSVASARGYGIKTLEDFESLIENDISNLNDPGVIPNIDKAVKILENPPVTSYIFGDYDVDGTFSSFMLRNILYSNGCKDVNFYIPHRKVDGYGLNAQSLENFIEIASKKSVGLVVFLDCGTNSKKEIEILKNRLNNPLVIIIDHHIIQEENYASNADVIVNNRLEKNVPPYCTGGLVYQLARKFGNKLKFDTDKLLPYAAITTVADVSPLCGDNRIIVSNGLKKISEVKNHGLSELMRVSNIDSNNCTVEDISFRLAPRINANGRIEHASKVIDLLLEKNEDKAFGMALEMNGVNEERRKLQKQMISHAINRIGNSFSGNGILIYNQDWEIGIVGIVASKLTEKYGVPSIVFGNHEGKIKGSARSVKGINIKEVMDDISYIFEAYGGHEMAAGASLKPEYAKQAHEIFEKAIESYKSKSQLEKIPIEYDVFLDTETFLGIDNSFCENMQIFGPFGQDNEKILFRTNGINCTSVKEWGSGSGAFISFEGLKMDCFFYEADAFDKMYGKNLDILFEIGENFKEDQKWALIIKDYKIHEENEETKYYAGIGSRETPQDILNLMEKIARHFEGKGYVLRSGGADGADSAFERGVKSLKEIFLPWKNFNGNSSVYDGENWKYKKVHLKLARKMHPSFETLSLGAKKLMVRNSAQIIGKDSDDIRTSFVVCYTKDGKASGGTGQAIRLARSLGIEIYNLHDPKIRKEFEEMVN